MGVLCLWELQVLSHIARASHLPWVMCQRSPHGIPPLLQQHRAGQDWLCFCIFPRRKQLVWKRWGGQMVLHSITVFVRKLSSALFEVDFFNLREKNHSFSLTTGTNFFQQQSYKNLPLYLQFPHQNPKEHSRIFCCVVLSEGTILNMPGGASGRRAVARCWECALGRQVIDGT